MGRRKLAIEKITDRRRMRLTLGKRSNGIMKKAYELAVLTGCDVSISINHQDLNIKQVFGQHGEVQVEEARRITPPSGPVNTVEELLPDWQVSTIPRPSEDAAATPPEPVPQSMNELVPWQPLTFHDDQPTPPGSLYGDDALSFDLLPLQCFEGLNPWLPQISTDDWLSDLPQFGLEMISGALAQEVLLQGTGFGTYYYDVQQRRTLAADFTLQNQGGVMCNWGTTLSIDKINSNNLVAMSNVLLKTEAGRATYCGKRVIVTVDGVRSSMPFFIGDGCERCAYGSSAKWNATGAAGLDFSYTALAALSPLAYQQGHIDIEYSIVNKTLYHFEIV
ncbi:hypothetical protein PWT90_02191 [Aphanocladium album]|nr:hypothetical protein PWT90_02191 [Aphanocladium album]